MNAEWPEPDKHDRWAWSNWGGGWRRVTLYSRSEFWLGINPAAGTILAAAQLVFGAVGGGGCFVLLTVVLAGELRKGNPQLVNLGAAAVFIGLPGIVLCAVAVYGLRHAMLLARDRGQRVIAEGMVCHISKYAGDPGFAARAGRMRFRSVRGKFLAIDFDGVSDKVEELLTGHTQEFEVGDVVRVEMSPHLHRVFRISILSLRGWAEPTVVTWGAETMGVAVAKQPAPVIWPEEPIPMFYPVDEPYVRYASGRALRLVAHKEQVQSVFNVRPTWFEDTYRDTAGNSLVMHAAYGRMQTRMRCRDLRNDAAELAVDGLGADAFWNKTASTLSVVQDGRLLTVENRIRESSGRAFATCMMIARRMLTNK